MIKVKNSFKKGSILGEKVARMARVNLRLAQAEYFGKK